MQQLKVIKLGVPERWEKLPGSGRPGLSLLLLLPDTGAGRQPSASLTARRGLGGRALHSRLPEGSSRHHKARKTVPLPALSPDLPEAMQEGLFILFKGFSYSSVGKEAAYSAGVPSLIPGLGRSAGAGTGCPRQCSGLENSADSTVHGVAESDTTERLSLPFHGVLRPPGLPPEKSVFLRKSGQEATVRTGHGTTDWFQIGKEVRQVCILSPCLFDLCRVHHVKCRVG